ncbi:phage shock protein B [Thalassotalea mangrovi]|uniref:Phage shock protein B n=1 Tax=Thalassotalea mangrovi TaxID=2572245 RepID=A0A4U1BAE8_9GAMM|nr:phage shock protein B [Thalassotalea mangrovi]TKB47117.1 phage shock protein B [Thalassotalea mangrovi]
MSVFNFIVIIVVASLIFAYFNERQRIQLNQKNSDDQNDALANEIEELRQRIATLEKIVTDKGYDLKDEIDRL